MVAAKGLFLLSPQMSNGFLDRIFNPGKAIINTLAEPRYPSKIIEASSGYLHTFKEGDRVRFSYNLGDRLLDSTEWRYLFNFFVEAKGRYKSFKWKDDSDCYLDKEVLVPSAGTYRVVKRYGTFEREIEFLDLGTIKLYNANNSEIESENYQFIVQDDLPIKIQFTQGNYPGAKISGDFFKRVRFNRDELAASFEAVDFQLNERLVRVQSLELIEVLPFVAPLTGYGIVNPTYPEIVMPDIEDEVPDTGFEIVPIAQIAGLNLPLVDDATADFTIYATSDQDEVSLLVSDGIAPFDFYGTVLDSSLVGTVTAIQSGMLSDFINWGAEMEVEMRSESMSLTTCTLDQFLAGANRCCVGDEVLSYRVAVQTGAKSYRLIDLWRGQRGTEREMINAAAGKLFAITSSLNKAPSNRAYINKSLQFKGVIADQTPDEVPTVSYTYLGNDVRPYTVANLKAEPTEYGVRLSWNRRARRYGQLVDDLEVPLVETRESYLIKVFQGTNQIFSITVTNNEYLYTGEMQNAIAKIYQIGDHTTGFSKEIALSGL